MAPYEVASGPGLLQKCEFKSSPMFSSRLTYSFAGERWYRILQYRATDDVHIAESAEKRTYHNRVIVGETPLFEYGPSVYWNDALLGYVEVASDELSLAELYSIAKIIIDNAKRSKESNP
ncbi:MAG: hypothetical protein K8H99_13090 [Nitrospirae bacterium]|nr:hypothetical protein [Fimbriimonadaceae bacterium]